jgi:hypothetical protein
LTINCDDAAADDVTKGCATFEADDFIAASGKIDIDYANGQKASTSLPGFLTDTDWDTFNDKAPTANPTFTGIVTVAALVPTTTLTECIMLHAQSAILPTSNPADLQTVQGTNFPYNVLDFDQDTDETAYWSYDLPANIAGTTAVVTPVWVVAACTATTVDDVCWQINGGGEQHDDVLDAALSGSATAGQAVCTTAGDLQVGPNITWTHGYDVTGAKDTTAIFKINRDADLADAACSGDNNDISGDVRLIRVRICYEVDDAFSGE